MRIEASAPSNIALIKYMGKVSATDNVSMNASLSFTLEHLRSYVRIEDSSRDEWNPHPEYEPLALSPAGQEKFLRHFARLKEKWEISGFYRVSSGNNFPADAGLASSASSFAALTLATYELARHYHPDLQLSMEELSRISRLGSGSSCRSFFSPWAIWEGEGATACDLPGDWDHAVILIEKEKKSVSSSEAHRRVSTSLLLQGRKERAEQRLKELIAALRAGDWEKSRHLCWNEFWEMHALFETSQPPFSYMTADTHRFLDHLRAVWKTEGDGPLITMDAGANVHLMLRRDQRARAKEWLADWPSIRSWN